MKGHDFSTSRGTEEQNSGAVSVSLKEAISEYQTVESVIGWLGLTALAVLPDPLQH